MSTADDTMLALLREISQKLDALPGAIAAANRKQGSALRREDRETLGQLLPAISREIGDMKFTIHDALIDSALAPAIEAVTGPLCGKTCRALGRLFARSDGFELDGYRISRAGEVRDGALWQVRAVK
jgi:hypothetical protein